MKTLLAASLCSALIIACAALAPGQQQALQAHVAPLFVDVPREVAGNRGAPRQLCAPAAAANGTAWACSNWAGTVTWRPASVVAPASEEELSAWLATVAAEADASGRPRPKLKVVGFAHSWKDIHVPADDADGAPGVTLALHRLSGITRLTDSHVEVLAGTSFASLYADLAARGLTLSFSPGGIQGLTVGGAVSVGFHGSQLSLGGVSSVVSAVRLLDTAGAVHDLSDASDPEGMRAAPLGVGQAGILTRVTLPVMRQFHLRCRRWRLADGDDFLGRINPELKATHDRYHWYQHPATDSWWPMTWEATTAEATAAEATPCVTALDQAGDAAQTEFGPDGLPLIMRWDNCSDISHHALTHAIDMDAQLLWNGELYVALDDAGEAAATRAILAAFAQVARQRGGPSAAVNPDIWLHARYVGGDTGAFMNPCYGTATCTAFELALVAHSMDAPLPPWDEWMAYFSAMRNVLQPLGGRPHHAKFFELAAPPAQPHWGLPLDAFRAQCRRFDPAGQLSSAAWDRLWGASAPPHAEL